MPERWALIEQLYHAALEREPSARAVFLDEACAGDDDLRREVASLLAYDGQPASFIEAPVLEFAARELTGESLPAAENHQPENAPSQIGAYEIVSTLGRGGMAEVLLAYDTRLDRKVALKLLPAEFTADPERVGRFEQEARAVSALNHPNIVTIFDIGEAEGRRYIATEYIEGETLREQMAHAPQKWMKPREALEIAVQVTAALQAAHKAGIMHRDIKPENVMVRKDGLVKVLDFGLAKLSPVDGSQSPDTLSQSGVVRGTVRYMSPEQARGQKVDHRTDIFSLGVMLYEILAGKRPFEGETVSDVIAAVLTSEPVSLGKIVPDTPARLQQIVARCLEKEPEKRFQSATDLSFALAGLISASDPRTAADARQQTPTFIARLNLRLIGSILAGALALALVGLGLYLFAGRGQETVIDSVAVLPFVNGSNDPNLEYLSDGLTESLINGLSKLSKLKVMSHSAVLPYRGRENDAQAVGKVLRVRAILTGRAVLRGDALLVSAELVDVDDNSNLWGEQYNRKLSDLVAIQGEISREVARRLRPRLSSEEQKRLTKHGTENARAYQLYLEGRFHLNKRTAEGIKQAIDYFKQAISLDSKYALAYTGLADSWDQLGLWGDVPARDVYPDAVAAAMKALELDDSLAEAHASMGHLKFEYSRDLAGAEGEYKRAIELNPNYATAHGAYAIYMATMGRWPEAFAKNERAQELDPHSRAIANTKGIFLYWSGQSDQAIKQLQNTIAKDPNFWPSHHWISQVYAQKRMYPEALAQAHKAVELQGVRSAWLAGYIYAVSGQRGAALQVINELKELSRQRYISPYDFAQIYAGLGDEDQAFAWLEKGYDDRSPLLDNLNVNPIFDGLRSDPRYANLARRMGFAPRLTAQVKR